MVIPEVSSERRYYIPMAFMSPDDVVCSNKVRLLPSATLYHFGVLTSAMHMDWMRHVTGRLKSDYQYSVKLVYNNFPWPQLNAPDYVQTTPCGEAFCVREAAARNYWTSYHDGGETDSAQQQAKLKVACLTGDAKKMAAVEAAARTVLDARAKFPTSMLADLYDPLLMPADLVKAHADLDRAVDRCYRTAPFTSDRQRVEFLFALYESITAPLLPAEKKAKMRRG